MSEVATSQPPPATDDGTPWGSFYTAGSTGAGVAPVLPKIKVKGKAKRKRSAEPKPKGERKRGLRSRGAPTGEDSASKGKRRSFSLRRGSHAEQPAEPAPSPVISATRSRRYAEPHVLVGVVGGTIIALAALMIALLYMIGNAA